MSLRSANLKGIRSIREQVTSWQHEVANPKRRVPLGFSALDSLVRGPAGGEVFTVVAQSHVGKSLMATNVMANNPEEHILFFSLEMPAHQVLHNLVSHVFGYPSDDLETSASENGNLPEFIDQLGDRLPFQVIVDDSNTSFDAMSAYVEDYATYFDQRPRLVIIDYLEEIGGGKQSAEGFVRAEASASQVKSWAKDEKIGVLLLHQANRQVQPWEPPIRNSAKYAGYTESDVFLGMWRPGWEPGLQHEVRRDRDNWVGINVLKNRVRGKRHDGLLYRIDPSLRLLPHSAWGPVNPLLKAPAYIEA